MTFSRRKQKWGKDWNRLEDERGVARMNVKNLIGTVLDTIIRIVLIVGVVVYTYRYAMQAYDFGYRVFAEEPVSVAVLVR